jgi:anti-sigma regulatory factor (Ser/Thr protein kinase)
MSTLPTVKSFRPHPSALFEIRRFVREQAETHNLSEQVAGDVILAVSEASANSMLHSSTREIRVRWRMDGPCVEVEVQDDGVFQERVLLPEVDGSGGHGIPLMTALADELDIRKGTTRSPGTTVRLVKCEPDQD